MTRQHRGFVWDFPAKSLDQDLNQLGSGFVNVTKTTFYFVQGISLDQDLDQLVSLDGHDGQPHGPS